jgi:hypothetical protein
MNRLDALKARAELRGTQPRPENRADCLEVNYERSRCYAIYGTVE